MKISQLCLGMDALEASDLFLAEGSVPAMRHNGQVLEYPEAAPLTYSDFQDFFQEFLPPGVAARIESERDLDTGVDIGEAGRFRLNISFQRGLLAMAVRRIPSGELNYRNLHIPDSVIELCQAPRGLILVTGATGSGKTTTLACMLNHINSSMKKHVVTIEDPIEYTHVNKEAVISQREIGGDTKDFHTALKHVVRQNPDVIFIGEMRDQETISTAVSAAMTGHLVAATMHTMDVQQTVERIISYYPEGMKDQIAIDLSYVLVGIVAQRLLPSVTGSRLPAFEVMVNTPRIQRLIASRDFGTISEAVRAGVNQNMISFNRSIFTLYKNNLVSLETACAFASGKDEFMLMVQGMETGVDSFITYSSDPDQGLSIKKLLKDAIYYKASDLILTVGSPPVIRIDGILQSFNMPTLGSADTHKLLYSILTPSQKADFEDKHELDLALTVKGINKDGPDYRFRVNAFYQKGCVAAAMRLIPSTLPSVQELGIPQSILKLADRRQGLVLVTGPTGSGKSTTLAALLDIVNRKRQCHIITIEDPIEFVHEHKTALVEQREVHADTFSFANALKYVLRQDPDVILVGEMRDPETISTVLTAAETGHLVFATLHTNDVTQSVDRIIDVFPSERQNQVRSQLAACLEAIIAQRLLPRKDHDGGRVAAFEVLIGTIAVKSMIREKKTHQLQGLMETAAKDGMITMEHALKNLVASGIVSINDAAAYLPRGFNS